MVARKQRTTQRPEDKQLAFPVVRQLFPWRLLSSLQTKFCTSFPCITGTEVNSMGTNYRGTGLKQVCITDTEINKPPCQCQIPSSEKSYNFINMSLRERGGVGGVGISLSLSLYIYKRVNYFILKYPTFRKKKTTLLRKNKMIFKISMLKEETIS